MFYSVSNISTNLIADFYSLSIGYSAFNLLLHLTPIQIMILVYSFSHIKISISLNLVSVSYELTYSTNFQNALQLIDQSTLFSSNDADISFQRIPPMFFFPILAQISIAFIRDQYREDSFRQLERQKKTRVRSILIHTDDRITLHRCSCNDNASEGDQYVTQIQFSDPTICHTTDCREKFNNQILSKIQRYSTLTLSFKLCNGSSVKISLVLCQFRILFPSLFLFFVFLCLIFVCLKFRPLARIMSETTMRRMLIVED